MRLFFAALAALLAPVTAQAKGSDGGDFRSLPPQSVAAQLLSPQVTPVDRVEFVTLPGFENVTRVRLFTRPAAAAGDFCEQHILTAQITPIPADRAVSIDTPPRRVGDVEDVTTYRHSSDCAADDMFFHIYGIDRDTAFADVRRLTALINAARANPDAPLPFPSNCYRDVVPSCSAAAMLADLSTGDIRLVARRRGRELRGGSLENRARRGEGRLVEISLVQNYAISHTVQLLVRQNRILALHISSGLIYY